MIPFAAFIVLVALACLRDSAPELRVFAAVALPTIFWLTLVVAAFASRRDVQRIEERNLFYVMPFFLIALVAWVARGAPRAAGRDRGRRARRRRAAGSDPVRRVPERARGDGHLRPARS